jgi:hypothetical protein
MKKGDLIRSLTSHKIGVIVDVLDADHHYIDWEMEIIEQEAIEMDAFTYPWGDEPGWDEESNPEPPCWIYVVYCNGREMAFYDYHLYTVEKIC